MDHANRRTEMTDDERQKAAHDTDLALFYQANILLETIFKRAVCELASLPHRCTSDPEFAEDIRQECAKSFRRLTATFRDGVARGEEALGGPGDATIN